MAAKGLNGITGIYVKSVVTGGAAAGDGRIDAGDQLLAVDDASLINVTQERAAELMTKSGPHSVVLTVAKEAASYNGLDALLCKSPLPMPMQQHPQPFISASSMPSLQQQQMNSYQPTIIHQSSNGGHFSASTLPRNHHLHQANFNQQSNGYDETDKVPNINNNFRARSASQEVLSRGATPQPPPAVFPKPGPAVAPRPISNGVQFTSPTNHHQMPYKRNLHNEQQVRYGSERPVSMHQLQIQQQQQQQILSHQAQQHYQQQQQTVRNLPNDLMPRFGSERPATMASASSLNTNTTNGYQTRRFNSVSDTNNHNHHHHPFIQHPNQSSPLRQLQHQPILRHQVNQQQHMQQQLDELEEINYNNASNNNNNVNNRMMMVNNHDELYGKMNRSNNMAQTKALNGLTNMNTNGHHSLAQQQQQHQNGLDEQQRTKSVGQLYEHIWNNNNNAANGQQTVKNGGYHNSQGYSSKPAQSVDDLNMRQLDLNGGVNIARISRPNLTQQQQQQQVTTRSNYENQVVNKPAVAPPPPAILTKLSGNRQQQPQQFGGHVMPLIQPLPTTTTDANGPVSVANSIAKNWEREQWTRQQDEEVFRMNLLRQRMEMLRDLESKPQRSDEDENRIGKLRTEIEFDKRVLEMNTYNSEEAVMDQQQQFVTANGEYEASAGPVDYLPDEYTIESRNMMNQMREDIMQRRHKFEEILKHDAVAYKTHLNNKLKSDEADRVQEAKREEQRLRKHIELNSNSSLSNQRNGTQEIEVVHVNSTILEAQQMARPQKHVQFVSEPAGMLMPPSPNSSPKSNSNKTPSSSSSSSDQLDSSPSTPPPALPSLQTQSGQQQQQHTKRVMFSDTSKLLEFERQPNNADDILPNTPCVIGANEVYVDKRLKIKQQQQQEQQMEKMVVEGEKLSFKDKMKLFAKQSGENLSAIEAENKLKVSRKQREIESKFEVK